MAEDTFSQDLGANQKLLKYIGYGALVVLAVSTVIVMSWLWLVPKQAITLKQPIPVLSSQPKPGAYVVLDLDYCKNVKATGRVATSLVSKTTQLMLPTGYESGPKVCQHLRAPVPIPPQATPGTYHFHFRAAYQINPLRSIVQEYDTESFEVQ